MAEACSPCYQLKPDNFGIMSNGQVVRIDTYTSIPLPLTHLITSPTPSHPNPPSALLPPLLPPRSPHLINVHPHPHQRLFDFGVSRIDTKPGAAGSSDDAPLIDEMTGNVGRHHPL